MDFKASIIGASGYVGAELAKLIATHPNIDTGLVIRI